MRFIFIAIFALLITSATAQKRSQATDIPCPSEMRMDTLVCNWALVADSIGGAVRLLNPGVLYSRYEYTSCPGFAGRQRNTRYYIKPDGPAIRIVWLHVEGWGQTQLITDNW